MAKVEPCNNSDLSVHLDSPQPFLPGQRITGYVSRTSRWVGTETNISIALHGRCNTEFFSRDSYLCRSSLELFGQEGIRVELFNGPLHIQTACPEGKMWRFAIEIPRHPDPHFLRSHPIGKASYLPLLSADKHALPPSFDLGSAASSRRGFAVVEYYLEAIMTSTPNSSSSKPNVARMPVQLFCESSPFPITDFDIKIHSRQPYTVVSPRLPSSAGNTDITKCSMGQKVGKVLGLSRAAPRLTFRLEISVASVLQLDSPYHIPFEMRAIPQWEDTSECISKALPLLTMDIVSFTLALRSTSSITAIATDAIGPVPVVREDHFTRKVMILADYIKPKSTKQKYDQKWNSSLINGSRPLILPMNDNTAPLDIGEMLDLKLEHGHFPVHEIPTFVTYNIKQTYELEWKMTLEIRGETLRIKGRHPVLIMEGTDQLPLLSA